MLFEIGLSISNERIIEMFAHLGEAVFSQYIEMSAHKS